MANAGNNELEAAIGGNLNAMAEQALEQAQRNDLEDALKVCRFSSANSREAFIESQGLTCMEDLATIPIESVKRMITTHNSMQGNTAAARVLKIGYLQQANLESLVWWLRDKTRRNLPIDVGEWDAMQLSSATELKEIEKRHLKSDNEAELPEFEGGIDYYDWDKKAMNALAMERGATGIPLDYVIRRDKEEN